MGLSTRNDLAARFGAIASEAGRFIMSVYESEVRVQTKADGSPVSRADIGAEHIIRERLEALLPGVPIIAEESFNAERLTRAPERFLLVDPLDGTREFISRYGEFTVNIALVEGGQPIVGCVFAPALGRMYLAGETATRAEVRPGEPVPEPHRLRALSTRTYPASGLCAVASRSHLDPATEALLERLHVNSCRTAGSSLKFCLIAQGEADVYPRLAPTMEWDTAAGQAVLAAAGGCVIAKDGLPLRYGKAEVGFRNESFVAWGRTPLLAAA